MVAWGVIGLETVGRGLQLVENKVMKIPVKAASKGYMLYWMLLLS